MFSLFKKRQKGSLLKYPIEFSGQWRKDMSCAIHTPENITLFSFSLPAIATIISHYKARDKFILCSDEQGPVLMQLLKYVNIVSKSNINSDVKLKKKIDNADIFFELEVDREKARFASAKYRVGLMKDFFPDCNVIYTMKNPIIPDIYTNAFKNMGMVFKDVPILADKKIKAKAWEFLKYRGHKSNQKVLVANFTQKDREKKKKMMQQLNLIKWFVVFVDDFTNASLAEKLGLVLVADTFLFDNSPFAYFAYRQKVNSIMTEHLAIPVKSSDFFRTEPLWYKYIKATYK